MAVLDFTQISNLRGSLGDVTYFRQRGGLIVARNRVTPAQPVTTGKTRFQDATADLTAVWNGATNAQRMAWNERAYLWDERTKDGARILTGKELFWRHGLIRQLIEPSSSGVFDVPIGLRPPDTNLPYEVIREPGIGCQFRIRNRGNVAARFTWTVSGSNVTPVGFNPTRNRYYGSYTFWRSVIGGGDVQRIDVSPGALSGLLIATIGITAGLVYFFRFVGFTRLDETFQSRVQKFRFVANA